MAIATGTAIAFAGGAALLGGIGGSLIQADAARDAARDQRRALESQQRLQKDFFQKAENIQTPFLQQGQKAFTTLNDLINQGLSDRPENLPVLTQAQGFTPQKFDPSQLMFDPGIQFAQDQARRSVERGAAARGGVLGRSTLTELQDRSMGLAGQQVNDAFQRFQSQQQLGMAARNQQLGAEQQRFGQTLTGLQRKNLLRQQALDRLSGVAQLGPQMATALGNQAIGQGGTLGDLIAQQGNIAAAREAALGQAAAGALQSGANTISQFALLASLGNPGVTAGGTP